jgi:CheY-like chemotaxis protein
MQATQIRIGAGVSGTSDGQPRAGLCVLVIEDDADTAQSCAVLLGLLGHRVQVALDGPAALRMAAEAAPDVALIDIGLPGMDGCEVARQLREQSGDRRPLLVAVTGYAQDEDRLSTRMAGIDLHLVKPVDPEALRKLLSRFEQILGTPVLAG